jgi:hypothetical protein
MSDEMNRAGDVHDNNPNEIDLVDALQFLNDVFSDFFAVLIDLHKELSRQTDLLDEISQSLAEIRENACRPGRG